METQLPYQFHTQPFDHQQRVYEETRDRETFAVFWEQGTGKSKVAIDTMGHLWTEGKINAAIVVAPNGVHRNWITDELPTHLPPDIPLKAFNWQGDRASTKWHAAAVDELRGHNGFPFLAITYDAWMTKRGKRAVWEMMKQRDCILILDESQRIKTPSANRTRSILGGAPHAPYRRILSGTPIANGPFDAYTQVKFLDPNFWSRELDIGSFAAFKSYFGVFERGWNNATKREFDMLVGYQNVDELRDALRLISSRVTKDEVLDLPPKLYTKRYYEMTPKQRSVYDQIEQEFMALLETGEVITTPLAITRLLRLQQVLCGYVPVDGDDEPTELIDRGSNPRLRAYRETREDMTGDVITWATYDMDIDFIMAELRSMGYNPVQYDGRVSDADRAAAKEAFQRGDATDFVAKASTGAEGLTFVNSNTSIYYNNTYRLIDRKQSEDRNHRIGQTKPVLYVDLVCAGTRDEHAIDALVRKSEIAAAILGDENKEWI